VDGLLVRPLAVRFGVTDGVMTEIVDGELREGMPVVVEEISAESATDLTNPFAPKLQANK
jgi:hypothetical protein